MTRTMPVTALTPASGSEPCPALPPTSTSNQSAPLWAWTMASSVGSSTIAWSARRPPAAICSAP